MVNKQHAQFSDENGNIFYLENETEDVLDPSGKPLSNGGDLSEASVTFTPDATRKLPQSGGRFKAFLGSIVKFLSDLTEVAFSGNYSDLEGKPTIPPLANNCTTTAAGYGLDARQGKVLMDKANQLSSDLGGLVFAQDADGNWGYKAGGADPVIPFKSSKVAMGGFKFLGNNGNPNGATVDVGFKPDFIMYGFLGGSDMTKAFYNGGSRNDRTLALWWSELQREFIWDSASDNPPMCIRRSFPTGPSTGNRLALQEVTDTGFKVYGGYGSGAAFYVCIKLK